MSRSFLRTAASRVRALAVAALLALAHTPAWAQSPEMQDLLNQINGEFRRTQGERLSQNCDYTAIDVAKQALQRAGFTNMTAGPVVIGALEKSCKAALSLTGAGLAADAYSLSKCLYEYYTTGMDARGLLTCLGVEAAGVGAGKLLDWLDVDPVTGAFSGQVFDRIGDDLKAGGLDEAAARLKEGEIRQFAERMAEALTQVQRTAREKAQSESPEPIVYTGFAYGCTVTIISRFHKGQPPTRGGNSVALQISIRDCECLGRSPTVGKAMKEASIFVTVPVDFTPGPGGSPAWTANLARMRTTIRSVCCDGTRTGADPPGGDTGGGTATGGGTGVVPGTPSQPVEPPPPKPPPTLAERCPECAPIIRDIQNDQYDIEAAQGRIDRADQELRALRNERADQDDEIARAQRTIEINRNRVSLPSMSGGGMTRTTTLTADGVKVTTTTHPDGRVETRSERTGNRDIDAARDRIEAARRKLEDIGRREAAARERRAAAARDKSGAEAKLRADQARLERCEEECRKRISQPPPTPPIGTVPGGGPLRPPEAPAGEPTKPAPPVSPPASLPGSPSVTPYRLPMPPRPACRECWPASHRAEDAWRDWDFADAAVTNIQHWLDDFEALLAGRPPIHMDAARWSRFAQLPEAERSRLHREAKEALSKAIAKLLTATEAAQEAYRQLEECNRRCATGGDVTVGGVIGVTGTNPFNPDNPIGSPQGPQAPPPPPPPGSPGTLQFSASSYATAEGQGVVVITVTRSGGATGATSVQYATGQNSAIAGADYQSASGTLAWADGEMGGKNFSVTIIDDTSVEASENFSITLGAPTGAATLGSPATATVSIADNDGAAPAGSLQFAASSYSAAEGQGNVTVTVTRSGGAGGAVSVRYITVSGTAGGSDFGSASATLTWADGDTSAQSFTIAIVDDTLVEGAETFSVQLSNPTGGATLGSPATATVNIADNDTSTGACGPTGNAWQVNSGTYTCFGSCDPCPTPQRLSVDGNRVTISPFHAGGAATFTGCTSPLTSDSSSLVYFGQANHRATLNRSSNTGYSAAIQSSGGGSCTMSCIRTGP